MAGCCALVVLLLSCGCLCSSFPRGAVDWSVVCDCGISWSYSLDFVVSAVHGNRK